MSDHHCNEHHGKYRPGPVYVLRLFLRQGYILTSTPMTGHDAAELQKLLSPEAPSSSVSLITLDEAQHGLERDQKVWETRAARIEEHIVDHHPGFQAKADHALRAATFLDGLSKTIT